MYQLSDGASKAATAAAILFRAPPARIWIAAVAAGMLKHMESFPCEPKVLDVKAGHAE
jgi:hypothetical protein